MKIGIYTLPLNYNYGGLLQAYALQTVLERMGHEVVVIDRPYIKKVNIFKSRISFWLVVLDLNKKTLPPVFDTLQSRTFYTKFINSKKFQNTFLLYT